MQMCAELKEENNPSFLSYFQHCKFTGFFQLQPIRGQHSREAVQEAFAAAGDDCHYKTRDPTRSPHHPPRAHPQVQPSAKLLRQQVRKNTKRTASYGYVARPLRLVFFFPIKIVQS
jgi:hypothetical protein